MLGYMQILGHFILKDLSIHRFGITRILEQIPLSTKRTVDDTKGRSWQAEGMPGKCTLRAQRVSGMAETNGGWMLGSH